MARREPSPGPARGASRSAIMDAAERLFARHGVGATSTAAIAKEAGVANGLIYYHFAGKQQLLDALIAERTFGPELRRLLREQGDGDPQVVLELVGREFLSVLHRRCDIASILLQEVATAEQTDAHLPSIIDSAIGVLADHLRAATDNRLAEPQARLVARMFMSTLLVAGLMLPPDEDPEPFVQRVAATVLAGGEVPAPGVTGS